LSGEGPVACKHVVQSNARRQLKIENKISHLFIKSSKPYLVNAGPSGAGQSCCLRCKLDLKTNDPGEIRFSPKTGLTVLLILHCSKRSVLQLLLRVRVCTQHMITVNGSVLVFLRYSRFLSSLTFDTVTPVVWGPDVFCLCVCLSVCLSVCPSVCLSV
jgi:hypothetical protein